MNLICKGCGTTRNVNSTKSGEPRIARGWKFLSGYVYCRSCKVSCHSLRTLTIPIATCDWGTLTPLLRKAWEEVTKCSNWLTSQYYVRDTIARDRSEKLPSWEMPYLYPEARQMFPGIEPTSVASVMNLVQARYRALRFDLWRNRTSVPVYRGIPLPLSRPAWKVERIEERWQFSFRFNGHWHKMLVRGGRQFARQLGSLEQILLGAADAGEAALYERDRVLLLKIVAWFPRQQISDPTTIIKANTDCESFLIARTSAGVVWRLNADHVLKWIVGSAKQQHRLREDLKAECRFPREMREGIVSRMGQISQFRANRLNSWIEEATMQLVNWAKRQHAGELVWDNAQQSMFVTFPWYKFSARLEDKCKIAGILFARISASGAEEDRGTSGEP